MPRKPSRPSNARRTNTQQRRRQHVLENVTVRAHQASRQRQQRFMGVVTRLLIVGALGVALYFGGKKLAIHFFYQNPDYNLAYLDAQSDGILTADDILGVADLKKGINIMKVDLERARARLSALPQVDRVQVTRQMPNRVSIQVNERKPVAWIAPDGAPSREDVVASKKSLFVDASGILLPPKKVQPQDAYLPIIRHYSGPTTVGEKTLDDELRVSLDLLRAQQESPENARYQIEEIDLAKHFGLTVTVRGGAHILLPLEDDMDAQLQRMNAYMQGAESRGEKVDSMNLLVKNNVPVTFQPPPPPPEPDPAQAAASPSPSPGKSSGNGKKDTSNKKGKSSDRSGKSSAKESGSKPTSHKDSASHAATPAHSPAAVAAPIHAPALTPAAPAHSPAAPPASGLQPFN